MNAPTYYRAPWEKALTVISGLLTAFCLCTAFFLFNRGGSGFWAAIALVVLVAGCGLFVVRGYTVTERAIMVHRLFWNTQMPLSGLKSAEFMPNAMRRSIRLFGNGGFFSITGLYRNKQLGRYRAFVTDRSLTVVLRFLQRTVVLSPESPEKFVQGLQPAQ